jgi:hypothetical protein
MRPTHPFAAQPPAPAQIHTIITGGMPGGQITGIAAGPRSSPSPQRCSSTGAAQPCPGVARAWRARDGTGGWHAPVKRWPEGMNS